MGVAGVFWGRGGAQQVCTKLQVHFLSSSFGGEWTCISQSKAVSVLGGDPWRALRSLQIGMHPSSCDTLRP